MANQKKGINCQYRSLNNCAYDLKQKQVLEEYSEELGQFDIRSTDMSQDFWYNGKANITSDTVYSYFRGQLSNVQHTVGLLIYITNVLEINNTVLHKFFLWVDSLHKGNFSVIFPPLLLKRDGECTEEEYKILLKRAIYYVVDIDIDLLNSFEIPELQRQVYNIIIRNDYDIDTYKNYKKLLEMKNRIIVFPFLFSMERTVVVHDICKLKCLCEQLGTKYKRFFENLNTYTSYIDFRPFAWGFADSLFRECHTDIEYQEKLGTLNYNKYLYERVLSEREENEDDGGFGLLHYNKDRKPTRHYVNSNGNKKTDSKQNNPLDYITGEKLNSNVKEERELGMVEYARHVVQHYDIEQDSFCTENEKLWFKCLRSRVEKYYFKPDKNGNISKDYTENDPYNLHLSLVFKKIIYDDPSNIPLVDDKTLLCHHIPSLDKITERDVLDDIVEDEKTFAYKNIHHHFCVDYNDSRLQPEQYQLLFNPLLDFRPLLLNRTLKETHKDFKYNRPKAKSTDMVTIHEDDSTIISIYFFRNDDRNRNFSMNGDISLNIFILRKTTGQIQTRKRRIQYGDLQENTNRSREENESEPDDSVVSSEHDDDDSSYRPGSSEEDESSSSSSGSVSLLSDDLEVIAQQRPLDDDTMSSLTETSSIFFPSPSPAWTPSGTGGNFSRLHDPNEEDGI